MSTKEKKSGWAANMVAGTKQEISAGKAGGTLHDRFAAAAAFATGAAARPVEGPAFYLPLDAIQVRADAARPVHEAHALDLALSIAAVGLIHFPVVNTKNELLAGGQRRAAIEFLHLFKTLADNDIRRLYSGVAAGSDLDAEEILSDEQLALLRAGYDRHFTPGIPVHRIDVDTRPGGIHALTIETVENEKRLDFSKSELSGIVDKLRVAGFRDKAGRPRAGERTLAAELERITGKSRRTVFRLLEELRQPTGHTEERAPSETSRTLGRQLSEHLALPVNVRDHPKKRGEGSITIRYSSFQERAEALRKIGLRD